MDLHDLLRNLGYSDEDIHRDYSVRHPLLKEPINVDFAIFEYGNGRYGMIAKICDIDENAKAELCGLCVLLGAKYGILSDGREIVVIKPKNAYEWVELDRIPSKLELEEELGIGMKTIIAISYEEYEGKVDDIEFVVENSEYVYSDMDKDEVVIVHPNAKLVRWLTDRGVRFREFEDEDYLRLLDLD